MAPQRKILLLQLPLSSHDYDYSFSHVPLALGVIGGFLKEHMEKVDIVIPPSELMSFAGDKLLLESILSLEPDIIGLSCYLWNIERSLWLTKKIKEAGLPATIVAGGPDIGPDNVILNKACPFDIMITGEGERVFWDILRNPSGTYAGFVQGGGLVDLKEIPLIYSKEVITPSVKGQAFLETSRGCPFKCGYCYYPHRRHGVNSFPLDSMKRELLWLLDKRVEEIIFVDPSFTSKPDLQDFLAMLNSFSSLGSTRLYAELNAPLCTRDLASELAKCGFYEVEVGLQTINPKALKAVNRFVDLKAFEEGVRALRDEGIRVMVDIIVGLPEDKSDDVKRTIEYCLDRQICDELNLFPLSVLPNTSLRRYADDIGLQYDKKPPYYVKRTPWIEEGEIADVFLYAEELSGIDYFAPELPLMKPVLADPMISELTVWDLENIRALSYRAAELPFGQSIKIVIEFKEWWGYIHLLKSFALKIVESNPFIMINWVIPEEHLYSIPPSLLPWFLEALFIVRDHPADRELFSTSSRVKSCQIFVRLNANFLKNSNTFVWVPWELTRGSSKDLWIFTDMPEEALPERRLAFHLAKLLNLSEDFGYRIKFIRP